MRALDATNPIIFKPSKFAGLAAALPLLLSLFCLPLALAVAPDTPFTQNPITVTLGGLLAISCFMLAWPSIFKWDWGAKYFGVFLLYLGSVALIGFVPCLCIAIYGAGPLAIRACPLLFYVAIHVIWCNRFVVAYSHAMESPQLRGLIYQEEGDAVYYMQRGDRLLLEKRLKFQQLPKDRYFVIFIAAAIGLAFSRGSIQAALGVPFIHIFLLVSMFPVSLTFTGLAVRGWLIFYKYPTRIERASGKKVYVDMSGAPIRDARETDMPEAS